MLPCAPAHDHYATALQLPPVGSFAAHQGMARVLAEHGDPKAAELHRQAGYTGNSLASLPYRGEKRPVDFLLLVSAAGGNIPVRHLLDDRILQTHVLTAEYFAQTESLAFHTVILNPIGDADLAQSALIAAKTIISRQISCYRPTRRAEDAAFIENMSGAVGAIAMTAPTQQWWFCALDRSRNGLSLACLGTHPIGAAGYDDPPRPPGLANRHWINTRTLVLSPGRFERRHQLI